MAGGQNLTASVQQSLGMMQGTKFYSPFPFAGMNLLASPTAMADQEFRWIENFLRIGDGKLRTAWDLGAPIYTAPANKTIIYFSFYTIGTAYYCAVFLSDGSAVQVNRFTGGVTTIGPAGTFYVSGGELPETASWGTQYLLISNRNTRNDYWAWDGLTLYQAGTVEPNSAVVTAGGAGYTSAPTVIPFGGHGTGLAIKASVNGGSVVDLEITNPGTGYEVGDIVQLAFSGGGSDTSARLTALIDASGVAAISISSPGTGYTSAPAVGFSGGGGSGATATATIDTGVTDVTVTAAGSGYTGASVAFTGGGGSGATATAQVIGGELVSVTVINPGTGYTSAPTVTINGDGTGATASAAVAGGVVSGVTITAPGTGYTSAPTVSFTGGGGAGAAGVATLNPGGVSFVSVVNAGTNYTSAPSVTFEGGGGVGATGIALLVATSIAKINVTSGGTGYQVAPTVTITGGGPGSGATATATIIQGQVVGITVTNGGSGYTGQPLVYLVPHNAYSTDPAHPPDTGSGATAQAVMSPTPLKGVLISSAGKGYTSSPAVVLGSGANNAASGTVALMPYGVSGAAMQTYQSRVWLANQADPQFGNLPPGGNFIVSAPGSFTDFATSDGGVQFTNTDDFLPTQYEGIFQSNGYLYFFGDGSISIVSSVATSGNPATTTFNYQNVDPQVGTTFHHTICEFGKTILFGNTNGVYGVYGGTAALASQKLTELFQAADFVNGVQPSAATAFLFNIKHYLMLMTTRDPDGVLRTVMATWNERDWTVTTQSVDLAYITTEKIGSQLSAWGTDGTSIYPLFNQPSSLLTKRLDTKVFGGAAQNFLIKNLWYHYIQAQDQDGSGIAGTVDIQISGMTPQPSDPKLRMLENDAVPNPWIIPINFTAPYPYWPVFATKCDPGLPFFTCSATFKTTSRDFELANWSLSYTDQQAFMV